MFANLKNKLIEEVKSSPAKLQQFANAAQAAVSSSASSTPSGSESTTTTNTNENFFSITEEDTPQNSPYKPLRLPPGAGRGRATTPQGLNNGAIPRTRKLSNSSMASDVSFRLPSYDAPAVYHLQSDLESNCSEMEDSASVANLDIITKEQLFDAYKKSLDRYHKYRCRYTDLAKKYKDLERDSTKARSVLVETQEKAIRRISELREQCTLEQQAKAHLEEALRVEMDDMQCKMQAYQTKLQLLGENPETITAALSANESLIDLDNHNSPAMAINACGAAESLVNLDLTQTDKDISAKVEELEKLLQLRETEVKELSVKLEESAITIEILRKQEEENALLLAQTKQAIHSELENKESEVKKLTDTIKKMQNEVQAFNKKEEVNLSGQAEELKELREKMTKQILATKQEMDAKIIANEHMLSELREQLGAREKALVSLAKEKNEASLKGKESEQKLQDLRQQNAQLSEMVQRYQQNEVSLAEVDNELNRTKNENEILKEAQAESIRKLEDIEKDFNEQTENIERIRQQLLASDERCSAEAAKVKELVKQLEVEKQSSEAQAQKVSQLETEIRIVSEQNANNESETIATLKAELKRVNTDMNTQLSALKEQLASREKELKSTSNKLNKQKKQYDAQQGRIRDQSEETEKLKDELNKHEQHLLSLQSEASARDKQAESEKSALTAQVSGILEEIAQLEQQMHVVQQSHTELEAEKQTLELKIASMQEQAQLTNREEFVAAEKATVLEAKLQRVESENSQLAEKNCLFEENMNRLEKLLAERERQQTAHEASFSGMRLKLETAEDTIQKLNEKMSQVLDENSRMQNAQELMDHDHRTLQDKCDSLEKEKLLVEDALKCLEHELRQSKLTQQELVEQLMSMEEKFAEESKSSAKMRKQLEEEQSAREAGEQEELLLRTQLNELKATQSDADKLRDLLTEGQRSITELQCQLMEKEQSYEQEKLQNAELRTKLNYLEGLAEELEKLKEERVLLSEQNESLNQELSTASEELTKSRQTAEELETKLKDFEARKVELDSLRTELVQSKEMQSSLSVTLDEQRALLAEKLQAEQVLQEQLQTTNATHEVENQRAINAMKEREKCLQLEISAISAKHTETVAEFEAKLGSVNADMERLHEGNDVLQLEIEKLKNKHQLQVQDLEGSLNQMQNELLRAQESVTTGTENDSKLANYEQMQLENEYLGKHAKQLESELEVERVELQKKQKSVDESKEKLKSIQCELYVLKENAEKHDAQLENKQKEITAMSSELQQLKDTLAIERMELQRQTEHAKFITEQNDAVQNELMLTQQQLSESEQKQQNISDDYEELKSQIVVKDQQLQKFSGDVDDSRQTIEKLKKDLATTKADDLTAKEALQTELNALRIELEERVKQTPPNVQLLQQSETGNKSAAAADAEHLRKLNATLQHELEDLKQKSTAEISNLQQEIEDLQINAKHMTERLMELERLRAGVQAQKLLLGGEANANELSDASEDNNNDLLHEKQQLERKLQAIMTDVQEVSNRNMFLEQQCENYLILEQSNERLKLQNAKLSRQLDETLVSMQHNESISANTEFEYLKNIMFQYLTGSANGNNETLVKVISAVLKFTPQQTQVALEKEHQRRSLINKIL